MATTLNFKDVIDLPEWQVLSPCPNTSIVGTALTFDCRNDESADPNIYSLHSAVLFNKYNIKNDEWLTLQSPALAGTFAAGANALFIPSGPSGLCSGISTTRIQLTTPFSPTGYLSVNQLANHGDDCINGGYIIRIISSGAGEGRVEERHIIANTTGNLPIVDFDIPLVVIPTGNNRYEMLSGRVMLYSGATAAAGTIRSFDVATSVVSSLNTTNSPTGGTDSSFLCLDEAYVPYTNKPGEGMIKGTGWYDMAHVGKRCLVATNSSANGIVGQATSGDAIVSGNEFRNYQIRIVEDTAIPAAVNQRRKIGSHTAGPSPSYLITPNWATTPSTTAKFVIENNNDVLVMNSTTPCILAYSGGFAPDQAWSAARIAPMPANHAAGHCWTPSFGIVPDTGNRNARNSYIYCFRGGATNGTLDRFDIAGASGLGSWQPDIPYAGRGGMGTPGAGSTCVYGGVANEGRHGYININGLQRFARFDVMYCRLEPWAYLRFAPGAVTAGDRLAIGHFIDEDIKISFLYNLSCGAVSTFFRVMNHR